ncbi:hypothetical protein ACKGJN_10955 [Gillisia sp. Q332]|uniref:hypothetical protein n=1 Tax=Gillisia xinjiangensis TaxID=3384765 RepID=UPI00391C60B3
MDGNKKIGIIGFAFILAISISACKVQKPAYAGLFVDNSYSFRDTVAPVASQLNLKDPEMVIAADSLITPSTYDVVYKSTSDSAYKREVKKLLMGISDSIHLMRLQIVSYQKQLEYGTDTTFTRFKPQVLHALDSLESKKDTIPQPKNQPKSQKKPLHETDTLHFLKEVSKSQSTENNPENSETIYQTSMVKTDTVQQLKEELQSQQNLRREPDTVYILKEVPVRQAEGIQDENSEAIYKELKVKNDSIQQLKDRLKLQQNRRQDTEIVQVIKEVPVPQESNYKDRRVEAMNEELNVKNNTIRQLKNQLKTQQNLQPQTDSDNAVKEALVMQEENKNVDAILQELNAKTDSIQQLKNRLKSEKNTIQETDTVFQIIEKPVLQPKEVDTVLITAYYSLGKTIPDNDVISELAKIAQNKSIDKAILSGYTDVSGNAIINKRLTNSRLEYLKNQVATFIPANKIYLQNFGDAFASKNIVQSERRVEIKFFISLTGE